VSDLILVVLLCVWLLIGMETVYGSIGHLGIYQIAQVNSAFHLCRVGKSSVACLAGVKALGHFMR